MDPWKEDLKDKNKSEEEAVCMHASGPIARGWPKGGISEDVYFGLARPPHGDPAPAAQPNSVKLGVRPTLSGGYSGCKQAVYNQHRTSWGQITFHSMGIEHETPDLFGAIGNVAEGTSLKAEQEFFEDATKTELNYIRPEITNPSFNLSSCHLNYRSVSSGAQRIVPGCTRHILTNLIY